MIQNAETNLCKLLRTKLSYFRSPGGNRLIDPASSTSCYTCLLTQRPFGPDGMPADAASCGRARTCFAAEE